MYARTDGDVASTAHAFLLAICTHPGTGVCFRDRGWYPREQSHEGESEKEGEGGGKIYNPILARFLPFLKPHEDTKQAELAIAVLEACPELVAGWVGALFLSSFY